MHTLPELLRNIEAVPWGEILRGHLAAFLVGIVCTWLAQRAARAAFTRRDFLYRVNFSLNYVENNELRIRTLKESDVDQIILDNPHGRNVILKAARNARRADQAPFLDLPEDCGWLVLNAILNEISEEFPAGHLAKSMGLPARSCWYVFGATCEWDDDVKMRKIRVMIVAEELLKTIDGFPLLKFQHPWHHVRFRTLLKMRELYQADQRAETAEHDGKLKRDRELAAMSVKQRQRAMERDRRAAERSLPRRNLMRIELTLPTPTVALPTGEHTEERGPASNTSPSPSGRGLG
jgi:hypothetical protein